MSLNPLQDPGNPANPNSPAFQQMLQQIASAADVNETDVVQDSPIVWILLGLFGLIIIANLLIL